MFAGLREANGNSGIKATRACFVSPSSHSWSVTQAHHLTSTMADATCSWPQQSKHLKFSLSAFKVICEACRYQLSSIGKSAEHTHTHRHTHTHTHTKHETQVKAKILIFAPFASKLNSIVAFESTVNPSEGCKSHPSWQQTNQQTHPTWRTNPHEWKQVQDLIRVLPSWRPYAQSIKSHNNLHTWVWVKIELPQDRRF